MDEVRETLLCEVANEIEAAMVVNLLAENEIPAHSDASQAGVAFGGLPFESGHKVFVAPWMSPKGSRDPRKLSSFQEAPQRPRARSRVTAEPAQTEASRRANTPAGLLRRELLL